MHKHKSLRLLLAFVFLLLAACDANTLATPSPTQVAATATALSTLTRVPTGTAAPAEPTATLEAATATLEPPTATPNPTDTPQQPTSTPADRIGEASPTASSSTPAAQGGVQGCPAALMPGVPRDSIGDNLYPELGNAGYDVQHYDLNLGVDVAKNTISGTSTINRARCKTLPPSTLIFTASIYLLLLWTVRRPNTCSRTAN